MARVFRSSSGASRITAISRMASSYRLGPCAAMALAKYAAAGQVSEAHSVATQAFVLYQRKGNLPGARQSLRYLTESAAT